MKGKKWIATLTAMMLVSSAVGLVACGEDTTAESGNSIVALDVNPSLELEVNEDKEVEKVYALNADAEIVLGDMRLENVRLDEAIDSIIHAMYENGYVSEEQNSILISVDAELSKDAEALKTQVSQKVSDWLSKKQIDASVITQSFKKEDIKHKADKDKISAAKATLIEKIIAAGLVDIDGIPYTYDELVSLNVYELKLMLESKGLDVEGIICQGVAKHGKFIGKDAALEIAYEDAAVVAEDVVDLEIEMDFDKHSKTMSYEIEFETATLEYEYEINAVTGEILEIEQKTPGEEEDDRVPSILLPEGALDEALALAAVYAHAQISVENVVDVEVELKAKRGWIVFCIQFEVGETEYKYSVDVLTGEILSAQTEREDDEGKGWHGGHGQQAPELPSEETPLPPVEEGTEEVPPAEGENTEETQPPVEEGAESAPETVA